VDLSLLRRAPDAEGPGLEAVDAADRLILDEATPFLARPAATAGAVSIIGDTHGALALSVVADHGATGVRVHQDALLGERAILANAARLGLADALHVGPADADLVRGTRLVLMRLPRSLDALDELAALIAAHAAADVVVVAGGRIKHMSVAMNDVLRRHFARLDVSLARQKSRVLIAREPIRAGASPLGDGGAAALAQTWPKRAHDDTLGVEVVAHGGVFAGTGVDIGTRFLLDELGAAVAGAPVPRVAVDLACGTGIVAVELARRFPDARILAADQSAAAVRSAAETAAANGVAARITVERADALEFADEASIDLAVLNPPFHAGAAVTTALAERLFADAGRALAPDGRLVCVWNSHLRYRPALERLVGPTRQIARNAKFTITVSDRV
jgi:16S rRNA (guanine1207-N2)-methyltransferase